MNASYDSEDDARSDDLAEALEDEANAASDAVDNFAERFETFEPDDMKRAGAFITIDTDGRTRMHPRKSRKNHAKLATTMVVSTTAGTKMPHVYG